jgi:hypothetical protein
MGLLIGIFVFLALMLAAGLLLAASASLRSIVRRDLPVHESKLLLPASDWYMPQNLLGNFRPVALFRAQPQALMASGAFRTTLSQARALAAIIVIGLVALLLYGLAA